jgi:predicted TPR repeat methyltransferase
MLAPSIFSKIKDYIKSFCKFFVNIPSLLKNQCQLLVLNAHQMKYNLKNFAKANTDLGIYHLNNQNYNDAIFRFKLVDRFFNPGDHQVHYLLGLTYFLKRNYPKAVTYLEQSKNEDKLGLLQFIKEINNVTKVPDQIYAKHRDIKAASFVDKFANKKNYDLPKDLIIRLMMDIDDLPKDYSVLDLGSNVGLLGFEICKRMQDGFTLTGVEISKEMIDLQKACLPDAKYNEIMNLSISDFLLKPKSKKYNIVVSLDGLAADSDLSSSLGKIHDILAQDGYFAFAIRTSKNLRFSDEYLEFSYNKDDISDSLKQNGFKIITWLELDLEIKNNYFIFICKK